MLTGAEVSVENRLFETLDPTTRGFEHEGKRYLVTDTVGFIRRLPTQLVEGFASTLEETLVADLVLHVVAAEDDDRLEEMIGAVDAVLHEIGADDVPVELVLNKIDQVDPLGQRRLSNHFPGSLQISAATGGGRAAQDRGPLRRPLRGRPAAAALRGGGKLAELYALGAPIDEREDSGTACSYAPGCRSARSAASPPISSPTRATRPSAASASGCRRSRAARRAAALSRRELLEIRLGELVEVEPASVASWATYQSTSPSSAAILPAAPRLGSLRHRGSPS